MHSQYKKYFLCITIFLAFISNFPSLAIEQKNENNLSTPVTLQEWKRYSQEGQITTCAGIILEAIIENNFNLPAEKGTQIRTYAKQLASVINTWINNNNIINDNEPIKTIAIINMLQLNWINQNYASHFLPKDTFTKNKNEVFTPNHPNPPTPPNPPKTTIPRSKVKAKPKIKLMGKNEGRAWVKKNLHLRSDLPLDELVLRFGQYEKKSIENAELYYFKRIDMTFFLLKIHSSMEFVGWAYGNS